MAKARRVVNILYAIPSPLVRVLIFIKTMDKNTWEVVKSLIDSFVQREELLKELLRDSERRELKLKVEIKKIHSDFNSFYGK